MNEKTPTYIIDLKNELKHEFKKDISTLKTTLTERMDKVDGKLAEIIENQEIHFETIGGLKVQVTGIELILKKKASHEYVKEIEKRTEKLEKVVFA